MDLQLIKKLIGMIKKEGVQRFEWEEEQFRISIRMSEGEDPCPGWSAENSAVETHEPAPVHADKPKTPEVLPADHRIITAPIVGTFYRAPSPTGAPFVKEGDTVTQSQVLAIIEAMKLLNELPAEYPCLIIKVLAENATSVEFGQPLFEVKLI